MGGECSHYCDITACHNLFPSGKFLVKVLQKPLISGTDLTSDLGPVHTWCPGTVPGHGYQSEHSLLLVPEH